MKKVLFIFAIIFLLTACSKDPYINPKYAADAVTAWFNYNENDVDLGSVRREQEEIDEIKNIECEYLESDSNKNYIYACNIEYSILGDTLIPLAKNDTKEVVVALTFQEDRAYTYIVYNSIYKKEDKFWYNDETLNYVGQEEK